jgi:hypothetical protein
MAILNANEAGTLVHSIGKPANRAGNPGSIEQAVVDGDTLRVLLPGGQGLRFLGCDTPEKSIEFPLTPAQVAAGRKRGQFLKLEDPRGDDFPRRSPQGGPRRQIARPHVPRTRKHAKFGGGRKGDQRLVQRRRPASSRQQRYRLPVKMSGPPSL